MRQKLPIPCTSNRGKEAGDLLRPIPERGKTHNAEQTRPHSTGCPGGGRDGHRRRAARHSGSGDPARRQRDVRAEPGGRQGSRERPGRQAGAGVRVDGQGLRGDARRRGAKVTSVQPIAQSVEVPRHVVLVLDNSYSMEQRKAIPKLLEGVGARAEGHPAGRRRAHRRLRHQDREDGQPRPARGDLPVEQAVRAGGVRRQGLPEGQARPRPPSSTRPWSPASSSSRACRSTTRGSSSSSRTARTSTAPSRATSSAWWRRESRTSACSRSITCRRPKIDAFLAGFASQNHGQARKAGTGADLLTLFQRFASRMDHYLRRQLRVRAGRPARLRNRPSRPPPATPAAKAPAPAPPAAAAPAPETPTAAAPAPATPTAPPAAPEAQGGSNWWLWLLLLIVLILIIYFVSRKSDRK